MLKERLDSTMGKLAVMLLCLCMTVAALAGCGSDKLVEQSDSQMAAIVESIQSSFAEEGWTYTGYELLETDAEHDTATVAMAYDVDGDAKELLKAHASEKPKDDSVYALAENINVKATVELSAYDKGNDALGCSLLSTTWYVGDTEADQWIQEQNKS